MEGRYRQHIIGTVVCQKCERTKSNSVSFFSHFYGEEKDKQTNPPQKKLLFTSIGRETFIRQVDWIKKKKPRIDFF